MTSRNEPESKENTAIFSAKDRKFLVGRRTYVMGILNVTPDSFSDGGQYFDTVSALEHARVLIEAGADIIDVGGESTRPGYTPVTPEEEIRRIVPVISAIAAAFDVAISIDTSKAKVAEAAIKAGASIVNDIWGFQHDADISKVAYETSAGVILMFNACDESLRSKSGDIVSDAVSFLKKSLKIARKAGIPDDHIIIDPGIGFGVSAEESLALIRGIPTLRQLGYPILLGPSRKRFIGAVLNDPIESRLIGTVAACCTGACLGADFFRVHDVLEVAKALKLTDAILGKATKEKDE